MCVFKRGSIYWASFVFNKKRYQFSTEQTSAEKAREVETDKKKALRDEIKERTNKATRLQCSPDELARCPECEVFFRGKEGELCSDICHSKKKSRELPIPTIGDFSKNEFGPWAEAIFTDKPRTYKFYRHGCRRIEAFAPLSAARLDDPAIGHLVAQFVASRRKDKLQTSSINRELQVLRRQLHLAHEWGRTKTLPKIKMLPGEKQRERVLTWTEVEEYLAVAEEPLRSVATVLCDSGLRPEEGYRLEWQHINWNNGRYGTFKVTHGKTAAARRRLPMTARVRTILEALWEASGKPDEGWVWTAPTASGHIEPSSLRKQHLKVFGTIAEKNKAENKKPVREFVLYVFRHTFLTRLGESGVDAWTLARIAGHNNIRMSSRYVHASDDSVSAAMERMVSVEKSLQMSLQSAPRPVEAQLPVAVNS